MNIFSLMLNPVIHTARLGAAFDGGGTVTDLIHPLADDEAWKPMGCLDDFTQTQETVQDDEFICYDADGNLVKNVDDVVVSDGFTWKSEKTNDYVTELAWGLTGPPVAGQPMVAFGQPIRAIYQWLKIEGQNTLDKSQFLTLNIYVKMKMANLTAFKNGKSVRPELDVKKYGPAPAIIRFGEEA